MFDITFQSKLVFPEVLSKDESEELNMLIEPVERFFFQNCKFSILKPDFVFIIDIRLTKYVCICLICYDFSGFSKNRQGSKNS